MCILFPYDCFMLFMHEESAAHVLCPSRNLSPFLYLDLTIYQFHREKLPPRPCLLAACQQLSQCNYETKESDKTQERSQKATTETAKACGSSHASGWFDFSRWVKGAMKYFSRPKNRMRPPELPVPVRARTHVLLKIEKREWKRWKNHFESTVEQKYAYKKRRKNNRISKVRIRCVPHRRNAKRRQWKSEKWPERRRFCQLSRKWQ